MSESKKAEEFKLKFIGHESQAVLVADSVFVYRDGKDTRVHLAVYQHDPPYSEEMLAGEDHSVGQRVLMARCVGRFTLSRAGAVRLAELLDVATSEHDDGTE